MEREFKGRVGAMIARKDVADTILRGETPAGLVGIACCNTDGRWTWLHSGAMHNTPDLQNYLIRSVHEWVLIAPGLGRVLTTVKWEPLSPKPRSAWDSVPMARQESICPECDCDCDDDCECDDCDSCECETW